MERKTKHRILGLVVVIALLILLYPLFQGSRDQSTKDNLVKAPPFPANGAQSTTTTTTTTTTTNPSPVVTIPSPEANAQANGAVAPSPEATPTESSSPVASATTPAVNLPTPATVNSNVVLAGNGVKQTPDDTISSTPTAADTASPSATSNVVPVIQDETASTTPVLKSNKKVQAKTTSKKTTHQKSKTTHVLSANTKKPSPFDNNGLANIQNSAWVIQLGSFDNKSNALRLVNQLRAKGYQAFMQHIQSGSDNETQTRVFVGPQSQEVAARKMAAQLETSLHLKGIVISYKPLNL